MIHPRLSPHHRHALNRPIGGVKRSRLGPGFVELFLPCPLEVDRIDEEHHLLPADFVEDLRNSVVRLVAYPTVDGRQRRRAAEIERLDPRVEIRFALLEEGDRKSTRL